MASSDEPMLPAPPRRSAADGPPSGRVPVVIATALAAAGLGMLVVGGARDVPPLAISGSLVSAVALGAVLYWRAALISYWQLAEVGPDGGPAPAGEPADRTDAAEPTAEEAEPATPSEGAPA